MSPPRLQWPALALAVAALVAGCGDDGPGRDDVVGAMTDVVVPERFDDLAAEAAVLSEMVAELCADRDRGDPAEVLDQASAVRSEWVQLSPFWFGPVAEQRSRFVIDWPIDAEQVDELAAGDDPVDATSLRELVGADQRGLGVVEHLFADDIDDRNCEYAQGAADLVADETRLLADAWTEFGATLATDDAAANDALAETISESLFSLAMIADGDVHDEHAALAQLDGIRWVMIGDESLEGIAPLLDDDVVEQLSSEFDDAEASPVGEPVMAIERTIKTNVVGDLGITVKFSDADGDG